MSRQVIIISFVLSSFSLGINCTYSSDNKKYFDGKKDFFDKCISCHLLQGKAGLNAPEYLGPSLREMSRKKISLEDLSRIKATEIHKNLLDSLSKREIVNLHYYILHSNDPKPDE